MKAAATHWEKIIGKHVSNKGLVSKIFKDVLKFSNKKTTQLKNG